MVEGPRKSTLTNDRSRHRTDKNEYKRPQSGNIQMASTHDHGIHDLAGITKLFEGNRIDTLIFNYGTSGPANYKLNKRSKHNLDEDESS